MKKFSRNFLKGLGLTCAILSFLKTSQALSVEGEKRSFSVTGYYSPLPNQKFYLTGSYASEIRLNGNGIAGADGTPVFPGMIAAPSSYAFGTKICLPNYGCGVVHDRGQAIVTKNKRKSAIHDRLDLWMGYGEEGLLRALTLGRENIEGVIYSNEAPLEIGMNFVAALPLESLIDTPERIIFRENLSFGSRGEKVIQMKNALRKLELFKVNHSEIYDQTTKQNIIDFQKKYLIIKNESDLGAGRFGPQTRTKLTEVLYKHTQQKRIREMWQSFSFDDHLKKGQKTTDTFLLQQILVQEEILDHVITGYFGPKTKEALTNLQIKHGIIPHKNSPGSGSFGPKTRAFINQKIKNQQAQKEKENDVIWENYKYWQNLSHFDGIVLKFNTDHLAKK